jgi:enolase
MKIKEVISSKIINSNSNYTIQVKIDTENGVFRGSSPAGESTSQYEISQFKDNIDNVIKSFNQFLKGLKNKEFSSIKDIYSLEKSIPEQFIGGASLSLSYALVYALSNSLKIEPYKLFGKKSTVLPISKVLGGGVHASNLAMDIQEILVSTLTDSVNESINGTLRVYKELKRLLKDSTSSFLGGVDPEGGFVTGLDNYESLLLAKKAIEHVIKDTGFDIRLGVDMAASTFYKDGKYSYRRPLYEKKEVSREEQIDLVKKLAEEFDLYYIEDPVDETLIDDYAAIMSANDALVVADDATSTLTSRLLKASGKVNATIIKPNQVGLLHKVVEFSELADKLKITKIVSHRSEETCIPIISDIAVGLSAKYLKVGINRGERVEKINRLLELS